MVSRKKSKPKAKPRSNCTGSKVRDHFNTRCQLEKARKKRAAKKGA